MLFVICAYRSQDDLICIEIQAIEDQAILRQHRSNECRNSGTKRQIEISVKSKRFVSLFVYFQSNETID